MSSLVTQLPTRGSSGRTVPLPVTAMDIPVYPASWVFALLLATLCTLPLLAFLNARGYVASAGLVGMCEAGVYAWCLVLQLRRVPPWALTLCLGLMSWIVFTWLIRQRIDLKSVRDLMIPILFLSLGRFVADSWFADRCMRKIAFLVLTVALLETIFVAAYGDLFNPFAFYAGLGSIRESAAMFEGQTLTLNGFRPESIGRTLLPAVFGSHRTSSVFLEPVSLGNFAVILLAWALSNARSQFGRNEALMCGVALVLIALSDSRFGMLMAILLPVYRLLPVTVFRWVAPTIPFVIFASILGVALVLPVVGDNLLGRIAVSGQAFLRFDEATLLGLHSPLPGFGDMGYAYVVSRFGVVTVIALIIVLFLIPVASERASRFRGLIVLYMFSNLAISGTSVFALKTAGLMWFLFGAVAADPRQAFRRVMRSSV